MRARCDWCGMEVEVLANGKCLLGHPIDSATIVDEEPAKPKVAVKQRSGSGSNRKPQAPKPPRRRLASPAPTQSAGSGKDPAPSKGVPQGTAGAVDNAADDEEPWVAKVSRPWAPVEPDGPSGPIASSYAPSADAVGDSSSDEIPRIVVQEPQKRRIGFGRKRETDALADEFAPPTRQRASAVERKSSPATEAVREPGTSQAEKPEASAPVSEPINAPAPMSTPAQVSAPKPDPKKSHSPIAGLPKGPGASARSASRGRASDPEPPSPARTLQRKLPRPGPRNLEARPLRTQGKATLRGIDPTPQAKTAPPAKAAPSTKASPQGRAAAERTQAARVMIPTPKRAKPPRTRPAPPKHVKTKPSSQSASGQQSAVDETAYLPRTRVERPGIFSPRHAVGWGLAIAATLLAGVVSLKLAPGRAQSRTALQPRLSDIALTSLPNGLVVSADPDTESRTRSELARNRSRPQQIAAATIKNSDGDIVALYEAIVFGSNVASSKRDLEDFISLYAQGAGVSGEAFTQRHLIRRDVWSALLPQGQAILLIRGPEVVIVITRTGGYEGDSLADTILTSRQL